jgi:hypothetical protein
MVKFHNTAFLRAAFLTAAMFAAVAACSSDIQSPTSPLAAGTRSASTAAVVTQSFKLSSVSPEIQCTDASGAVTTVTGGTLDLLSNGKFTATFATQTNTNGVNTTGTQTVKGTFTQSGTTFVFKVPGSGTFTGTLDSNGNLTIANLPLCGTTHTAVFTRA